MNSSRYGKYWMGPILLTLIWLLCAEAAPAFAAADEAGAGWRPVYDKIMMCVNFAILVAILYKLLKTPLKNFFNDQRRAISDQITQLQREKEKTEAELREVESLVTAGDTRIQDIKEKMTADGEALKTRIIENAREQSEYMLASAKKNINNQFLEARKAFRAELIELAMSSATRKLVREIDHKDHEKLVNKFLYDLAGNKS